MKKIILLSLLIFVFRLNIFSGTNVSGLIEKTENWIPQSSPYVIDEMAIIGKKGFVTIYPGTEVKFKKGAKLLVCGTLYVKGDANNPVRFVPFDNESFYEGIYFSSGTKSIIEFSIMMRGSITVEATRVELNNNYILNSTGVILKNFSDVVIKNNYFYNNTYGVHIEGSNVNLNIFENTFFNNRYGIYIMQYYGKGETIKRNNFINNKNNITNYSIGQINCKENYWGTDDEKKIVGTIMDKRINPKVGEVIFKPYAKEKFKLYLPSPSYISLVKTYLSKKKPEEDIYRFSFGGGMSGFFPLTPDIVNRENNFGMGYFATFAFDFFGPTMLGIETNFYGMENKNKDTYKFNLNLSEYLLNFYVYFGYKKNVYLIPYARLGNGICMVSEAYKSENPIFDEKNSLKYNEVCYALSGGAGLEWFLLDFFSLKFEGLYHYVFYQRGNISFPDVKISGNVYFKTPFILNR
ncbi:MAG: right-handed parallel beta-helix repeat-containing protein [Candidatus Goldbacteria bacterium]|nr:right-handed parallel beta-helix repeat-containing protein [Candidatus Goldiibacteriota bacterium]